MGALRTSTSTRRLATGSPNSLKDLPSWYVVSREDRMIAPDGERAMAKTMNAHVSEVNARHVSMLSKPDAITAVIMEAVKAVPK
jgi:pimeloyl-ACP methyl ester carboxylesterase